MDTYDIIVMDAYYADALPFHLTTQEFFRQAKARLAPDGVLAYNLIGSVEGDRSKLFRSMYLTASGAWRQLWAFPIGFGTRHDRGRTGTSSCWRLTTASPRTNSEPGSRTA